MCWWRKPGKWLRNVAGTTDRPLDIVLLEPYLAGSHESWAQGLAEHSCHRVTVLGLDGRHWKWRMHGGAVSLAREFLARNLDPDLILASDMLDLTTFLALTREATSRIPTVVYCHENQLTYPWSPADRDVALRRDGHYAFINYTSVLAADAVMFNSVYHQQVFLEELPRLPRFLDGFPDFKLTDTVRQISAKSQILPLGLDLRRLNGFRPDGLDENEKPMILWNHRWEYDKNPSDFFAALYALDARGVAFDLAVLGEAFRTVPAEFSAARTRLADHIVHWGYADSRREYAEWLWRADVLPVTSVHDFFGVSVVEAIYCGCYPLLPGRLAYPEHLPETLVADFCYEDNDDLLERLQGLLGNTRVKPPAVLRDRVSTYDWSQLAGRYDALFSDLVTRK